VVVGTRLGKYEILKRLATGGMAEIFLARVSGLPGFHKMVVIKRILPQLATKTDFVEMFLDEARIAATLQHPNVVTMYDVGVVDGNYFIAMEYLHGEDARSIAKALKPKEPGGVAEKLPLEHALNIVIGVASGLHYAHEKVGFDGRPLEIVHRDVTPQNIYVTYEGGVKLLDFGIAKASNRFGETRFGTLKGKVPYMSPEQCRGEPLDRRSDLFSLGIMLYELTLGMRLYKGKSDFEVLKQIVEGTVTPPRELDPNYPPELDAIVMRSLEKEKSARYQTAHELQADLEALVRADRLHVSPITLAAFMRELFGPKIEAWREAQAQGKSLDEHLVTMTLPPPPSLDEDDEEDQARETEARGAEALARERAAFRARIDAEAAGASASGSPASPASPAPEDATVVSADALTRVGHLPEAGKSTAEVPSLTGSGRALKVAAWIAIGTAAVAVGAGVTWRLRVPVVTPLPSTAQVRALPGPGPVVTELEPPRELPATAADKGNGTGVASPGATGSPAATGASGTPGASPAAGDDAKGKHAHEHKVAAPRPKAPKGAPLAPVQPPGGSHAPAPAKAPLKGDGTLLLASSPWCNVSIDGVNQGPTPISVKLPAGRHTVVLSNPEFKISRSLPITIVPNETLRKRLDFAQ
jgi:serine/threonine protein kinase